ncbi:hypothetical protein D910_09954 [Dendroctonus ponderosae]|uniref:Uncharacterized protein n=1 Tax=Dendroctonus ponderosae TaxID=77166 RepID=U4UR59_DENPD|nr:hypothetical protein D910_09954 [Dendroctonus ponderosae]KAH1008281.1 hypothetical protein HUJ05_008848 [Dendroctonus ponderosae]
MNSMLSGTPLRRISEFANKRQKLEIRNLFDPLRILVDDAKNKLLNDLSEVNAQVQEEIRRIEQEPHGHDISRCIRSGEEELTRIDNELIQSHLEVFERIQREAEEEVDRAIRITTDIIDEIEAFGGRVESCRDVECASDLDVEIVELYERIVKDLDGALEIANEAALIKLGLELDEAQLDHERYEEETRRLVQEVRSCADERV